MGTTDKDDQWRRKCHIDRHGQHIKNTYRQTNGHQRERVLFPSTKESNSESIYHDGSTAAVQKDTRILPDVQVDYGETTVETQKHGKCSTGRETTPVKFTIGYKSF